MKKFKVYLFIFMLCLFYNVNALEQDNLVEIIDNKITFDTYTTDFSFKVDLEENEVITSCYNGNNNLTCECTEGVCNVKLYNYGVFNITFNVFNSIDSLYNTKNIYVNNATDEYLEHIVEKIPNEIHTTNDTEIFHLMYDYAPSGVNINYDYGKAYKDYQVYNLTIKYTYNESNEYKYISKEKSVKVYNDNSNTYHSVDLFKNATYSLANIYGFSNIQLKNYIFFSEDEDIATISSKGIIKGINSGSTYIRVYNTTDLSSYKIIVNVKGDKIEDIDVFKQMFDGKEININASTYDYFESYVDYDYQNNTYEINYENFINSYINQQFHNRMSKDFNLQYDYNDIDRIICEDNICNFKLTYYHRTNLKTIVISNIKVNVTGLILRSNSFSVGNKTNLAYYSFLKNNDNIEIIYDEEYFVKDEDFALTPIKAGETSITIKSSSIDGVYISTRKVSIYDYNLSNNFNEYINNLNEIELPYKDTNFSDISSLDLLEQVISNKIYNEVELDSDLKKYLSIDTYCITNDKCLVMLNLKTSDTLLANSYNKVISIKFNNTKDLKEIIEKYNNITDMFIDTIDVIKLKDLDGTFDDNVLNYLGYKSVDNVVITKMTDEYIKNNVLKDSIYNIKFIDDENKLFEKNITITYNFIITMPISLDSSDESKVSYLNTYYNSILNKSISVENINNDIYKINNDYEIILDKKDEIYYTGISMREKGIELGVNEEFELELYYYPIYANTGKAKITSMDDSIAKVNDDGIITALKKGFTYIEVEYGYCISRVLVAVDMSIKDVLNSYLDKLPDSVIVEYFTLRYNEVENAIRNELSSSLGQFSLGVNIEEDNGKYYATVTNYDEFSDKKELKC